MRHLTLGPAKAACTHSASQSSQLLARCTSIATSVQAWHGSLNGHGLFALAITFKGVVKNHVTSDFATVREKRGWPCKGNTLFSLLTFCSRLFFFYPSTRHENLHLASPAMPGMVSKLRLGWLQAWPAASVDKAQASELSLTMPLSTSC